jgi:DNA-binding ferritin-like protein
MENFNLSFPIEMIKKEQRIISGIATADNIDKAGDIVDFSASLEAFKNWGGNIREMHSPVAVGKAVNFAPIKIKGSDGEEYNAIRVDAYISKGAQDTWEKILDGTLQAFSIGGKVLQKSESTEKTFRGRPVNVIEKYVLGELSVVDNPANALATVDIIKRNDDGGLDYVLDKASQFKDPKGGLTAAGRAHFKQTEGANLKPGVKGPADTPEKMRRKGSFLTRFFTNPSGPMKDPKGRPTRLALSAAAWGEPVPQNAQDAAELAAKGRRLLERYQNTKEKSVEVDTEKRNVSSKERERLSNTGAAMPDGSYPIATVQDLRNAIQSFGRAKNPSEVKAHIIRRAKALGASSELPDSWKNENMTKEGEVTAGSMGAGIKNPTQGSFQGPFPGKPKKKKKEFSMKNKIKKNSPLTDTLNNLLSNAAVLYFSSHRAHWNVEGVDFREYHDLFGEIYADVFESIDSLAENIRKLGDFPIALGDAEDTSSYEDDSVSTDATELAMDIYQKNQIYLKMLKEVFNVASDADEQGVANFLAERIDQHQKWDWQLRVSIGISDGQPDDDDESEDSQMTQDANDMQDDPMSTLLSQILQMSKFEEESDLIKMQDSPLHAEVKYDKVLSMEEQENRLTLLKRLVKWLVTDVQENTSTIDMVEVTENTQEEIMDIEILKDALSAVVDEKLATFATSIKEEVEASIQDKIDNITKGFEAHTDELEQQVKAYAEAGAIKKSVDPEDEEEGEELIKSASNSVWDNVYLPQNIINALGYKS